MALNNQLIVMYDGDCGFCSRTVQFVLKKGDPDILFTPLGSPLSNEIFEKEGITDPDLETFYFFHKGQLFQRSKAAFYLARHLNFPYNCLSIFRVLPFWLTDPFYNVVARNRKRIAGESCLLPSPEERTRFIREFKEV